MVQLHASMMVAFSAQSAAAAVDCAVRRSPRGRAPATSAPDAATCRNARRETCLLHSALRMDATGNMALGEAWAMGAMSRFGLECGRPPGTNVLDSASATSKRATACASRGPRRAPGPTLVKAANWLTHLEYEWESPVWRHWIRFFSEHFRFVRYDERGCGMTDWNVGTCRSSGSSPIWKRSSMRRAAANRSRCSASRREEPHASRYTVAASGTRVASDSVRRATRRAGPGATTPTSAREYDSITELMRVGWGTQQSRRSDRSSRRGSCPDATEEQLAWFNELCLKTASGANAADAVLEPLAKSTCVDLSPQVPGPDARHPRSRRCGSPACRRASSWRAAIPNAQFVELDSSNHILLEHEPAWRALLRGGPRIHRRAGAPRPARIPRSPRSRRASARSWR